jgi:CubicO group peptidase (beta-lactamase class C family)
MGPMNQLDIAVDPASAGLDPARLSRITTHFDDYVSSRRLSGWLATVSRGGKLAWVGQGGDRNREKGHDVTHDTLWRIFSMTKPITSIAAMMLHEEGKFDLNDDAGRWIEALREPRVFTGGTAQAPVSIPSREPVRVWHLLSHTAGLTYAFQNNHPVDAIYRAKGYEYGYPEGADLNRAVDDWCSTPLLYEPGTAWNYSVATDVLGRLVEIWSGQSLDTFIRERILEPLGMHDTVWHCPEDESERLAMMYVPVNGDSFAVESMAASATQVPQLLSGGSGLMSTAYDYQRFTAMLLNGGELDGVRLVAPRTLELMTSNHLADGHDISQLSRGLYSETGQSGIGFGLGFSVMVDPVKSKSPLSEGTFAWGGGASTAFWVDPKEELTVSFFTQLLPSWTYPIRRELHQLVYGALVN